MYQRQRLHRNVNRLIDTKGMNRILEKPLKTRGSGTLGVAGIPCLILGLCWESMGIRASRLRGVTFDHPSKAFEHCSQME
ncbi:hypothetical protein AALB52_23675 [Lachnospiraceae bacterium 38-14]